MKDRPEPVGTISLTDVLQSIKSYIWLVIAVVIFFTADVFLINRFVIEPTFDSSVKFFIQATSTDEDNPGSGLQAVNLAQRISNTYVELMKTNSFIDILSKELNNKLTADALREMITYENIEETEILSVNVRTHDPELSLEVAKTVAKSAPVVMNGIKSNAVLKVIDQPLLADKQSTPRVIRNTCLGFVLGLVVGVAAAILVDALDNKIRTEEDINKNFDDLNVLGVIPKVK